MLPENISTLFSEVLEKFETILGQPTDSYLVELYEVLSKILLVILYDKESKIHNFFGIINEPKTSTTDYTVVLSWPHKPTIYDMLINDDEKAPVRARKEATHNF